MPAAKCGYGGNDRPEPDQQQTKHLHPDRARSDVSDRLLYLRDRLGRLCSNLGSRLRQPSGFVDHRGPHRPSTDLPWIHDGSFVGCLPIRHPASADEMTEDQEDWALGQMLLERIAEDDGEGRILAEDLPE